MQPTPTKISTRSEATTVKCRPGIIEICSTRVLAGEGDLWRHFLLRIAAVTQIESVEIDRRRGMATLSYGRRRIALKQILDNLVEALSVSPEGIPSERLSNFTRIAARPNIRLYRRNSSWSTWRIFRDSPGILQVGDPEVCRNPVVVDRLAKELCTLAGVRSAAYSVWRDALCIEYAPPAIDRDRLLAMLDQFVSNELVVASEASPSRKKWGLATASLGLAAAGTLFAPVLLSASAVLLVGTNLSTFREGWRDLRQGRLGLPGLQTVIVVVTLASGGYLAANLMNWLLVYWRDRRARMSAAGRQMLVDSICPPDTKTAWVLHGETELATPLSRLEPGVIVSVHSDETIPVDGRVVEGTALVDECFSERSSGYICRKAGDAVFRGSMVVSGELKICVGRGADVCGGVLTPTMSRGEMNDAGRHRTDENANFAERAIPPTLMTAGLGLLVGDASVAGAVLRPDYATGPDLGDSFAAVEGVDLCLGYGIIVHRLELFNKFADSDVVVFEHDEFLDARQLHLEEIQVSAGISGENVLDWGACLLHQVDDGRARAIMAAFSQTGRPRFERSLQFERGTVAFDWEGREISIAGLDQPIRNGSPATLAVLIDGRLAANFRFRAGGDYEAKEAIEALRGPLGLRIEIVSAGASNRVEATSQAIGADGWRVCQTDADREKFLTDLKAEGRRVVFVGNCHKYPLAAAAAFAAVSTHPQPDQFGNGFVLGGLLDPSPRQIAVLRETALGLRKQLNSNVRSVLAPNLLCVAGALLLGFSSLAVVAVSNLGTFSIYSRSQAALRRVQNRSLRRRNRLSASRGSVKAAKNTRASITERAKEML